MHILGISAFYHDAAAALLRDGEIVAAAEEERFTRRKHDANFPEHAIQYCLQEGGISAAELDYIGFYDKPLLKFERILSSYLETFPRSFRAFLRAMPIWLKQKIWVPYLIRDTLKYRGPILFIDHHLSHAAASYLVSPFTEAAILTLDGVGEWSTTAYGVGRGREIELTHEIRYPHSLGLLYSAFTAHLGFEVNDGEYKVMGLAAYGQSTYYDRLREMVDLKEDGSFQLDMTYFGYHYSLRTLSEKFYRVFGPSRSPEAPMEQRYADMAASIQKLTEEVMLKAALHLYRNTGLTHLCLGGGVALNCVANGRILQKTPFQEIFIQPAAGDAGGAIGVAAYIYHTILGRERTYVMRHAYLGPGYSDAEIQRFLDEQGIPYRECSRPELLRTTARLIAEGQVVGWFQGRMEFGPRALGSRSILADARDPKMKDILNEKIKHREQFRPFAPSVLWETTPEYFDIRCPSPYMLLVADVLPEKRHVIPAVTHTDGTARLQTVTKEDNDLYYDLIQEYYRLTGVPVIINTSFNVRGEPIVRTPQEAFNCFAHTDMDYLVMGPFLIEAGAKRRIGEYAGRAWVGSKDEVIV